MWELDHKEGWALMNWCFWIVVLEKTLESPLDWKEIKPVNPKGNQPWIFIGRTNAEVEAPILWPCDVNSWLIGKVRDAGKDWRQEETGDEMVGWHHWLDGHGFEQTLGVFLGFPCGSAGKESACNAGDLSSIPGLRSSPGEGKGYPLQYPGLENSRECIVHGVAKSQTWVRNFHFIHWEIVKDREASRAVVHGVADLDITEQLTNKHIWRKLCLGISEVYFVRCPFMYQAYRGQKQRASDFSVQSEKGSVELRLVLCSCELHAKCNGASISAALPGQRADGPGISHTWVKKPTLMSRTHLSAVWSTALQADSSIRSPLWSLWAPRIQSFSLVAPHQDPFWQAKTVHIYFC